MNTDFNINSAMIHTVLGGIGKIRFKEPAHLNLNAFLQVPRLVDNKTHPLPDQLSHVTDDEDVKLLPTLISRGITLIKEEIKPATLETIKTELSQAVDGLNLYKSHLNESNAKVITQIVQELELFIDKNLQAPRPWLSIYAPPLQTFSLEKTIKSLKENLEKLRSLPLTPFQNANLGEFLSVQNHRELVNSFISHYQKAKELNLNILKKNDGHLIDPDAPHNKNLTSSYARISAALLNFYDPTYSDNHNDLRMFFNDFVERALPSDVYFGHSLNFYYNPIIQNELDSVEGEPDFDVLKEEILANAAFEQRPNSHILQRALWDNLALLENGGFVEGTREIILKTDDGVRKEVQVELNFRRLGKLTLNQSHEILKFLVKFEEQIPHPWLTNQILTIKAADTAKSLLDSQGLIDRFKSIPALSGILHPLWSAVKVKNQLSQLLTDKAKIALPTRLNNEMEKLSFLTSEQKSTLTDIATQFTYEMHQKLETALITFGEE